MPQTIIEHSFPINSDKLIELFLIVNQNIAKNEGNFDISQCKTRSTFCENFLVADGDYKTDFMHITIKILNSRTLEVRKNLAENIFKIAGEFLTANKFSEHQIALSLDVREMEKEIYQKGVL